MGHKRGALGSWEDIWGTKINWGRRAGRHPGGLEGCMGAGGALPWPLAMGDTPCQPCRPVPRVHAFGKGKQALRRDTRTPPAMQGWLHKQVRTGEGVQGLYGV